MRIWLEMKFESAKVEKGIYVECNTKTKLYFLIILYVIYRLKIFNKYNKIWEKGVSI